MKSRPRKRTPNIVNLTVKRRYLTEREVERLMDCAREHGRYGHRDATMILVAYRHGLRASEVCDLQWQQIELSEGRLHVHRVKNGIPSVHPIRGDEMRALRKLRREYPKDAYVFVSERGGPIGPIGCAMPVGSNSRTMAMTPGPCSTTSGTRTSSTRSDTPKWRPTGSRTFGGADLISRRLAHLISRLRVNNPSRKATVGSVAPSHLAPCLTRWRREGWHRLRNALDHLGARAGFLLRNHRLNELDRALDLLIGHRLNAAGMLQLHLARHQHCADFQIAGRTFPAHPLEDFSPMLLPVLRQIEQKALIERSARGLW